MWTSGWVRMQNIFWDLNDHILTIQRDSSKTLFFLCPYLSSIMPQENPHNIHNYQWSPICSIGNHLKILDFLVLSLQVLGCIIIRKIWTCIGSQIIFWGCCWRVRPEREVTLPWGMECLSRTSTMPSTWLNAFKYLLFRTQMFAECTLQVEVQGRSHSQLSLRFSRDIILTTATYQFFQLRSTRWGLTSDWEIPKGTNLGINGLVSADRNNKATLPLTTPRCTIKSSAKDLSLRIVKLQYIDRKQQLFR